MSSSEVIHSTIERGLHTVLVVDDNAAAREIMHGILQSMQMRAVSAVSAPAAIADS